MPSNSTPSPPDTQPREQTSNEEAPKKERKRTSVACTRCRQRKIKCTDNQNAKGCESCRVAGKGDHCDITRPMQIVHCIEIDPEEFYKRSQLAVQTAESFPPLRSDNAATSFHLPQTYETAVVYPRDGSISGDETRSTWFATNNGAITSSYSTPFPSVPSSSFASRSSISSGTGNTSPTEDGPTSADSSSYPIHEHVVWEHPRTLSFQPDPYPPKSYWQYNVEGQHTPFWARTAPSTPYNPPFPAEWLNSGACGRNFSTSSSTPDDIRRFSPVAAQPHLAQDLSQMVLPVPQTDLHLHQYPQSQGFRTQRVSIPYGADAFHPLRTARSQEYGRWSSVSSMPSSFRGPLTGRSSPLQYVFPAPNVAEHSQILPPMAVPPEVDAAVPPRNVHRVVSQYVHSTSDPIAYAYGAYLNPATSQYNCHGTGGAGRAHPSRRSCLRKMSSDDQVGSKAKKQMK